MHPLTAAVQAQLAAGATIPEAAKALNLSEDWVRVVAGSDAFKLQAVGPAGVQS